MSDERDLLIDLVLDGELDAERQQRFSELLQADPKLSDQLANALRTNDLTAREFNPSRDDAEFLEGLLVRLDIDFGDGGVDGDGGSDGPSDDGQGIDQTGLDGLDAASGFDGLGSAGAAAGASGGAAAGGAVVSAGAGMLGWAVGVVVAVAVGTTIVVMNRPSEPTPPQNTFEVISAGDKLPTPAVVEIVPTADVSLFARWRESDDTLPTLDVVQERYWKDTRTAHLQFNLAQLPRDYGRVRLRLYCISAGNKVQPLGLWETQDNWSEEPPVKALDRRDLDKVFARWEAKTDSYWEIDVTDFIRAEQAGDGVVSFGVASLMEFKEDPNPEVVSFASREHPVADQRPVLIIERSQ